jgi:hypothetical protein
MHTIARPKPGIVVAHELAAMLRENESRGRATAAQPVPGDFLIHQVSHWAGVLLVGLDRDDPQLSCQTYSAALAHAERLAARSNVDVWRTNDGACFERLATYRH